MKPVFLGLATVAAMALPATHVLAGHCGGGQISTPDEVAMMAISDLPYAASSNNPTLLQYLEGQFDPSLAAALPASTLASHWSVFQSPLGEIQSVGTPVDQAKGTLTVVSLPIQFANGQGKMLVTVNPDLTIDGVAFVAAS